MVTENKNVNDSSPFKCGFKSKENFAMKSNTTLASNGTISYFKPRTFECYEEYLKPMYLEGYLDKRSKIKADIWKKRWFVMEQNAIFYYNDSENEEDKTKHYINFDSIISVQTARDYGSGAFKISCDEREYILRAENKDKMTDWLFQFQRTIASLITDIIHSKNNLVDSSINKSNPGKEPNRSISLDSIENQGYQSLDEEDLDEFNQMPNSEYSKRRFSVPYVRQQHLTSVYKKEKDINIILNSNNGHDTALNATYNPDITDTGDHCNKVDLSLNEKQTSERELVFDICLDEEQDKSRISPKMSRCEKEVYTYVISDSNYGVTSLQGIRDVMEDVCTCISNIRSVSNRPDILPDSLYAIFDGHSGSRAAKFFNSCLPFYLVNHSSYLSDIRHAFIDCFRMIDKEYLEEAHAKNLYDGTTAAIVLRRGQSLITANAGDSRAVLSVQGNAIDIIRQQTPGRADEKARIESAGGWITEEKELHMVKLRQMDLLDPVVRKRAEDSVRWITVFRVNGELSVSRAVGDPDYKGQGLTEYMWNFPSNHEKSFSGDLIIPDPEIQEIEIKDDSEFFILACDGLWDTMDSQEAVDHVRRIFQEGGTAQDASDFLAKLSLKYGASDNVSVIIVLL